MGRSRTLIIGLDGATFGVIEPLLVAGYLPTFKRLLAQGAHGPLLAWPNMNTAASWTSMVTGYNPGQHGVYSFGDILPQRGRKFRPTTGADRKKDPFWRLLSAAGQDVGIVNVPVTYPADAINGFMLTGMDTPSVRSVGFAYPADLYRELRRNGIDYLIDVPNLSIFRGRAPYELPAPVVHMVDARLRTILHLMESRDWDVLMAVFVATDRVQHIFWPEKDSPIDGRDWAPIRTLYQQIDTSLDEILKRIDSKTSVLLVSDHGFGPVRRVNSCLNQLFAHQGLLRFRAGRPSIRGWLASHLLIHGRRLIPQSLQRSLAVTFPAIRHRAKVERQFPNIEWSRTRVAADNWGCVHINLRGREPEGIVSANEYDSLREQVRDILLNLEDPTTGRRLVRDVYRREDVYQGPYLDRATDVVIRWNEEVLGDSLLYTGDSEPIRLQAVQKRGGYSKWTGEHRAHGILIAYGRDIRTGVKVADLSIYDIAPTVLHLQGYPIPSDMDGDLLTDILTVEGLHRPTEVKAKAVDSAERGRDHGLEKKEARQIEDRLRNLGYLD